MIEVFSHSDTATVGFYRSLLEEAGIRTFTRNDNVSGAEVMVPVFYPAVCVLEEEDEERALEIIKAAKLPQAAAGPDRACPACGEMVPATFAECWGCSAAMPEE